MKGRTLILIKPDAVSRCKIGEILSRFEAANFKIVGMKMLKLSNEQAKKFYIEHKDKNFYDSLTQFMTSNPIVAVVLEGENIIEDVRSLMGATNPAMAKAGTIRSIYGTDVQENAVHGSDSEKSANREIPFFFSNLEIFSY